MANPFRRFRKHQKVWLAFLALAAMISFVILPIWMDSMSSSGGKDPVVVSTTRYGDIRETKLRMLVSDRLILRGFFEQLAQSAMEAGGDARGLMSVARALGSVGEEEVVETWLMAKRAEELGIMVSDQEINQFLSDLTSQQKVSREAFLQAMQYRHISDDDLFRILRQELLALRLQQMFGISLGGATPAQRWDYYQRLNERARIEVAALPVADFVDQVPDPDDATLQVFFDQHKKQYFDPASPEPGFHEPQKIALEYFKANVDAVAVSDAEIEKYYQEHKDTEFVQETLPEVKKEAPTAKEETKEAKETSEAKPEAPKAEKPAATDAKPAEKATEPAEKKEEPQTPAKDKTSSMKATSPFRLAAYQPEDKKDLQKDGKPEGKQTEAAKKDVPKPAAPAEAPVTKETKPDPKAPEAEKKAEKEPESKPATEQSKYIPLEKVKARIRNTLADGKIRETLNRIQDRMSQYHDELTLYEVRSEDTAKKSSLKAPEKPDFAKLAKDNGLGFYTTPLNSPLEVNALDVGQSFLGQNTPFLQYAFETLPKYRPEVSQDVEGNYFLFWKTDQVAERIPEFKEPGVRERVLRAWKMVQARKLAEDRAKQLAEEARKAGKPLKDVFAGQPKITVQESEPFSWMTYGAFPAWWAQTPPQISKITAAGKKDEKPGKETEIVDMPGNDFMRQVFGLEKGQVSVALNQPKTVTYVVRIADVTPAIWQAFLAEDFSRYVRVAEQDQRAIAQAWRDGLKKAVNFEWKRSPEQDRRRAD